MSNELLIAHMDGFEEGKKSMQTHKGTLEAMERKNADEHLERSLPFGMSLRNLNRPPKLRLHS